MMSFVEDHGCHGLETWTFEASPITKLQQVELNISPFVRHVQYLTVIMNGWQKVIVRVASRPGVLFGLQNWVRGRTLFGVEIRKSEKMVSELKIVSLIFKKKDFGGLAMVTSGTNHVVSCKYIWYQSSQIFVRTSFDVYLPRMVALPFDLVPNASHTLDT